MKVLLVDDDVAFLNLFENMAKNKLDVYTAEDGKQALKLLHACGPFPVVISDYRMPGMDGLEFLEKALEESPETVRILLSGQADTSVLLEAVNVCKVFKVLIKPCNKKDLSQALREAFVQHRLISAEKELMGNTLNSIVKMVGDVASILRPGLYDRTSRILPLARSIALEMNDPDLWATEAAASLSILGYIFLSEDLLEKLGRGQILTGNDHKNFKVHARDSARLISRIPRFEKVTEILSSQEEDYSLEITDAGLEGDSLPLGSRILRVVSDYDRLLSGDRVIGEVVSILKLREGRYDPKVLGTLEKVLGEEAKFYIREVYPLGLEAGMVLAQDIIGKIDGKKIKLVSKGQKLNETVIDYIHKHAENMLDITKKVLIKESSDRKVKDGSAECCK
jgi:response regulator RpfG family c-di-GMP phosphodiesterase